MNQIRIKASVKLAKEYVVSEKDLKSWKVTLKRAIASALPDGIKIDTVDVTSIKENKAKEVRIG
jgi:hypothetical protein